MISEKCSAGDVATLQGDHAEIAFGAGVGYQKLVQDTLGIALASLLSSYYFSRFAKVWDRRLQEIEESECALKKTLGLDEA